MSSISLLIARYVIVAAAVVAACYSALLARASFLFQQDTAISVPAAVHLVPYNSAYLARLAVWQPDRKFALLQRAVDLNPFAAESWIQLGLIAEMQQHDVSRAERYYLKAAEVDHMFLPRSTLANFYFRRQDESKFFEWARATLNITPFPPFPVFDQMWLFTQNAAQIAASIPERPSILIQYAMFLSGTHQFAALPPVVSRLVTAAGSAHPESAGRDGVIGPIEDNLLAEGSLQPALQIWTSMKDGNWITLPAPAPSHPLTNGDFATSFFGHGFDWTPTNPAGVRTEQIPDQKEVRFTFSGSQAEHCSLLQQYLPLDPNHSYRLHWKTEAQSIETPSGLAWRLHPVRSNSQTDITSGDLLASPSGAWDFEPPAGSEIFLLTLEYSRPLGNILAKGTIDLQSVSLEEQ
ncbi:MAG: hypothetical protein JOZ48_03070 [Acidobacteriaceae bacterium]|nr:hypothetical protein [Acidobacteriaceae bacterium]